MKFLALYVFHQVINVMRTTLYFFCFILLYLSFFSSSLGLGPKPSTQNGKTWKEKKTINHFGRAQSSVETVI